MICSRNEFPSVLFYLSVTFRLILARELFQNHLPMEKIRALYRCKPATSYSRRQYKISPIIIILTLIITSSFCSLFSTVGLIVHPFTLSYHPFAMLSSYKAVQHSKKQSMQTMDWLCCPVLMCNSVKSSNQFFKCQEGNVRELKLEQCFGVSGSGWQKNQFLF